MSKTCKNHTVPHLLTVEGDGGLVVGGAQVGRHEGDGHLHGGVRGQLQRHVVVPLQREVVAVGHDGHQLKMLVSRVHELDLLPHPAAQLTLQARHHRRFWRFGYQLQLVPELSHQRVEEQDAGRGDQSDIMVKGHV